MNKGMWQKEIRPGEVGLGIQHFLLTLLSGFLALTIFLAVTSPFFFWGRSDVIIFLAFLGVIVVSVLLSTLILKKKIVSSNFPKKVLTTSLLLAFLVDIFFIYIIIADFLEGNTELFGTVTAIFLLQFLLVVYYFIPSFIIKRTSLQIDATQTPITSTPKLNPKKRLIILIIIAVLLLGNYLLSFFL